MPDLVTRAKWDKAAPTFDLMASGGAEVRWKPSKQKLFAEMDGKILFLALGTGLDIPTFPSGKDITAIDISPGMLEHAKERIEAYDGTIHAKVMDVHEMTFETRELRPGVHVLHLLLGTRPGEGAASALPRAQAWR